MDCQEIGVYLFSYTKLLGSIALWADCTVGNVGGCLSESNLLFLSI